MASTFAVGLSWCAWFCCCPACRSLAVSGAVRRYLPAGGHRTSEAQAAEHCSCENGYLPCT
ncbi:hypothetical protein CGCSCA1_v011849 [Colletotrichum siamense]|nr:hypothetical protein CGCSCA1_v011849 [Colletotrichum siamense]